jgi:hypothetical protein
LAGGLVCERLVLSQQIAQSRKAPALGITDCLRSQLHLVVPSEKRRNTREVGLVGIPRALGSRAFLLLYLIDMDSKASVERLYYMHLPPHSAFPELQLGRRCS